MQQHTLIINGMHGDHCVQLITKILSNLEGVNALTVEQGRADLTIDEAQTSKELVISAIEKVGYKVVR